MKRTKPKKRPLRQKAGFSPIDSHKDLRDTLKRELLRLINDNENGHVRVAAIRLLLEKSGEAEKERDKKRDAAVAELRGILEEFAAAKRGSGAFPRALDKECAAGAADAG